MAPATPATPSDRDEQSDDVSRVTEQLRQRLEARSVLVHARDSVEDLGNIWEAVEAFEAAVEARGGDLMVDEPPAGHAAEPDDAAFVLPTRDDAESAQAFVSRIESMSAQLRAR